MRVRVYRNLHRKTWSVQAQVCLNCGATMGDPSCPWGERMAWRVVWHARSVKLSDVKLVVKPAGRARVLRDKRKNVHAWAEGRLEILNPLGQWWDVPRAGMTMATYSPYVSGSFMASNSADYIPTPVHYAPVVWVVSDGTLRLEDE